MSRTFADTVAPGASVNATFKITSPAAASAGFLTGKAAWPNSTLGLDQFETTSQRLRNASPIKINEVRLGEQFIELYNASESEVDISGWSLINTMSQWAPVKLATIPAGTKLAAHGFYLLGLSSSGLAAPASSGATTILVRNTTGFEVGQKINIGGETRTIASVGTAATAMTTVFIPVSTGPWLKFPAGSTSLPVTSADGLEVGQKIGMDIGGNYELATVTAVGKAATQTALSEAVAAGATNIKVTANADISVGDTLTVDTGGRKELVTVKSIVSVSAAPAGGGRGGFRGAAGGGRAGEIELAAPLKFDHVSGVNVSDSGNWNQLLAGHALFAR